MTDAIPVIDVADYLAGRPNALNATARQVHDALTTVGFLVLTGHDVPGPLIQQTFAEAQRFHDLPMANKLALGLNEHNNGYMAMGRYAVWTSDVNTNDKPDLNEAFFVKRERAPDDPLRRSGRRFVGAECLARGDRTAGVPSARAGLHRHDGRLRTPHAAGGGGRA